MKQVLSNYKDIRVSATKDLYTKQLKKNIKRGLNEINIT